MPPPLILKLEDLIKYRNSLTELWREESFQPVLIFLSSLYKENVDGILYLGFDGSEKDDLTFQERRVTARMCNMLYNLPQVLLELEASFEQQRLQKQRFAQAQESGATTGLREEERKQAYNAGQVAQMNAQKMKEEQIAGTASETTQKHQSWLERMREHNR